MNTYIFSLSEYFDKTQKYYYFFDGLIRFENKVKKDVLKTVDIYDVSYRADRLKEKVKNKNRQLLLDYFKYKDVNKNDQLKYEICISKIYYCTYFVKLDVLTDLLKELDTYIDENNYLKPLFVLFKILGTLTHFTNIDDVKSMFSEEVKFLKSFLKTSYFTNEFAYLYRIIMLHFDVESDMLKLDEYSNSIRELRWLDYTIRSNFYYFKKEDSNSLMYYNAALEELQKAYNIERSLRTICNIAAAYNHLDKYQLSLNVTEKVIKYAFSQEVSTWIQFIAMHYLFSNYMLKRYDEVINFYNVIVLNEDFLLETSIIIIYLSAVITDRIEMVEKLLDKKQNMKNLQLFILAIKNIKENKIVDLLDMKPTPYLTKIATSLYDI